MFTIDRIDHVILTVRDIAATTRFYARVLGMQALEFKPGHPALAFGDQQLRLHRSGAEFIPHAARATPGSVDLCVITQAPMDQVIAHLRVCRVTIVLGPIERLGARGTMDSVYLRDPDGNLVEIARYREPPAG